MVAYVVIEIYSVAYSESEPSRNIEKIFLSKEIAEDYIAKRKEHLKQYASIADNHFFEIEEAPFDGSM